MPSARILPFSGATQHRPVPSRLLAPVIYVVPPSSPYRGSDGVLALAVVTFVAAFLYLSGALRVARHDFSYAALLAAVWCFYYTHEALLRRRRVGPLLQRAGQVLVWTGGSAFFGWVYWLILAHP